MYVSVLLLHYRLTCRSLRPPRSLSSFPLSPLLSLFPSLLSGMHMHSYSRSTPRCLHS